MFYLRYLTNINKNLDTCFPIFVHMIVEVQTESFEDVEHVLFNILFIFFVRMLIVSI
jgi:hypothetical protein